jgi:hypothetical protein
MLYLMATSYNTSTFTYKTLLESANSSITLGFHLGQQDQCSAFLLHDPLPEYRIAIERIEKWQHMKNVRQDLFLLIDSPRHFLHVFLAVLCAIELSKFVSFLASHSRQLHNGMNVLQEAVYKVRPKARRARIGYGGQDMHEGCQAA